MAGNYRSSNSGIASKVAQGVRSARSPRVRAATMEKQKEHTKELITHRETERRKSDYAKASHGVAKEKVKLDQIKARGSETRKTVKAKAKAKAKPTSKPKNDLQVGKKTKEVKKKAKLPADRKW